MNCRPGDLALLISDEKITNIGKIGKILSVDNFDWGDGANRWEMEFPTILECEDGSFSDLVSVKDECLRPVSGLPMPEETHNTIKEHV